MTRDLGGARTTARPSSRQCTGVRRSASVAQQLGDLTVQTCPDGIGDLQVDRFAQQRMAEPHGPAVGSEQSEPRASAAARAGLRSGSEAISRRSRSRPAAARNSTNTRAWPDRRPMASRAAPPRPAARFASSRAAARAVSTASRGLPAAIVTICATVVDGRSAEASIESAGSRVRERCHGDLGDDRAARPQRAEYGVEVQPRRELAAGQDEQNRQAAEPPPGVGDELEAGHVRLVEVLERQQQGGPSPTPRPRIAPRPRTAGPARVGDRRPFPSPAGACRCQSQGRDDPGQVRGPWR